MVVASDSSPAQRLAQGDETFVVTIQQTLAGGDSKPISTTWNQILGHMGPTWQFNCYSN